MTDLDAIDKLAQAATPGPWTHYRDKLRPQFSTRVNEVQAGEERAVVAWPGFDDSGRPEKQHAANAAWIAALSPDVWLTISAELRALRAGLAEISALTLGNDKSEGIVTAVGDIARGATK